ncbi:MAG: hypothetical protein JOY66_01350 [Acetobacteraceae bacterium]|nr:hypothetical protein [Acetobacteraceae bacterium]
MRNEPVQTYVADEVSANGGTVERKASLKTRAISEARRFLIITLYLWVLFAVFSLHRTLILEKHSINAAEQGFAIVNALILAKVMLVADDLKLGRQFKDHPLIYRVLWSAFLFAAVLVAFHIIEHAAIALWRGRPIAESLADFGAGNLKGVLSVGALAFVSLIPFFAFQEVARVVGSGMLWQLLFTRGKRFRLLVQE